MPRQFYRNETMPEIEPGTYVPILAQKMYATTEENANLISSIEVDDKGRPTGMHLPAIDIDLPCEWVPSSTPGHGHLFIDKALTWDQYRMLLHVLAILGIVEEGYVSVSEQRFGTMVRTPNERKPDAQGPA